jgi:hypothetical protein
VGVSGAPALDAAPEQTKPGPGYGPVIVDGRIRYTSVSALKKGDPSTGEGCLRRYAWRYKEKKKEPTGKGAALGSKCHDETAKYLLTGEKRVSAIVSRGLHLLPAPGPDLNVELEISGSPPMSAPVLDADGIPMVGKIDLLHARGVFVSGDERGDVIDPPNTVEVIDHKFVGSFDRNLTPQDFGRDLQMAGYAEFVFRSVPTAARVRLSHNYFHTKAANQQAVKVSTIVSRDQAAAAWEKAHRLARMLKDVVAFRGDTNQIEANPRACSAYGGCPHGVAGYCTAYGSNSLNTMFGAANAAQLGGAGASGVRLPVIPASTATQLPVNEEHMQQSNLTPLAQQFMSNMQSQATSPPPPAPQTEPQGFREAVAIIDGAGWGWPALEGEAAYWRAVQLGHPTTQPGIRYQATGELAKAPPPGVPPRQPLLTAAQVIGLAQEFQRARQQQAVAAQQQQVAQPHQQLVQQQPAAPAQQFVATQPMPAPAPGVTGTYMPTAQPPVASGAPTFTSPSLPALLPPEAPASNPALAAAPMALPFNLQPQGQAPAPAAQPEPIAQQQTTVAPANVQPDAIAIATGATPPAASDNAAGTAPPAAAEKGTRKKAAAVKKTGTTATTALVPLPADGVASPGVAHVDGFELYVDCIPVGRSYEDFQPLLAQIAANVIATFGGGCDIRCSSSERLSHGKWKGELAVAVATAVATPGLVPAGVYVIDTRGSELAAVAAESLAGYPGARGIR